MKILALPRNRANPYQELLYRELRQRGVAVTYIGSLTPSYTLNQLLLPFEVMAGRLTGARLVHLHWVYDFAPFGGSRSPLLSRAAQAWFGLWLTTLRLAGLRLAWTAHNVLPQRPVFADDLSARRRLVRQCDLVIAHSQATLDALAGLGMAPRLAVVIPHGPFTPASRPREREAVTDASGPRRLLFFGNIEEYKGVDDLLVAFEALPADLDVRLTVAGRCDDPALRQRLTQLAARSPGRVDLSFGRLPEDELTRLIARADVAVLPFRRTTTSGSALFALCHGRPVIVPELPGLAELPGEAVFRYDGTVAGLTRALIEAGVADSATLARMSAAARAYGAQLSWGEIADQTLAALGRLLNADVDVMRPRETVG
jgi:glycosyltransferase involved in cell wall biosynthesis